MRSARLTRRIALLSSAAAIVAMGTAAGCSNSTKESPTTDAPASSQPMESTEKYVKPIPSFNDRAGEDSHSCGPGKTKVNGVCQ